MKRYIEPLAELSLFTSFFLILGCIGASDCNRPFPLPLFLIGCGLALIGFIFTRKAV